MHEARYQHTEALAQLTLLCPGGLQWISQEALMIKERNSGQARSMFHMLHLFRYKASLLTHFKRSRHEQHLIFCN